MSMIDLPVLYKRTAKGEVQTWHIRVEPETDGTAVIVKKYGLEKGKQQETRDHIKEGKNLGKKNETTAAQQAVAEAEAEWTKHRERKHYGLTVEESDIKILAAPMLAHVYEDHANKINWQDTDYIHVQPKFDGHRCTVICDDAMNIKLISRQGTEITTCDHLKEQLYPLMDAGTMLDGELYIHGLPLNKISSLIRRQQPGSADLCYMLYDKHDEKLSFKDRFLYLEDQADTLDLPHVHLSRTQPVDSEEAAMEFQSICLDHGYEGTMLRHGRAGYRPGKRSANLLKMKSFFDGEFTIVGCREGRGTFTGMAIFECTTADGNKFDVTAPGTHEEKQEFWQNHSEYLGKRLVVKYQKFTETDAPVPFLPVAKGIADNV